MLAKGRSFYEEMQNCPALDLRDARGKVHNLSFVLLGVLLGILRKRDGVLSSIHRSMVNTHSALCTFLGIPPPPIVSRSHLPVLLQKVDVEVFDYLLFMHYNFRLDAAEKQWFSGDGKELRGSIDSGKKRGQAVVQVVNHHSGEVIAQNYYNGQKESEIPALRALLSKNDIASQKITLDALHLCPNTTEIIAKAGGVFLIGLKENQSILLADMADYAKEFPAVDQKTTFDFKHGRIEQRKYWLYDISKQDFDPRWDETAFKSLVKVQRTRINQKNAKISREVSYYISNETEKDGIFDAVRNHWSVEVNNHLRDVTLSEDQLRSKKKTIQMIFAELRTLAIKLLKKKTMKNYIEQIEFFQDDFNALLNWLKSIRFL